MLYYTIKPSVSIENIVKYFWVLEGRATSLKPYVHREMANGSAEMVFHYKGSFNEVMDDNTQTRTSISNLNAQSQSYRRFIINEDFGIFGVYLYPYSISQLFSISAVELKNQHWGLNEILNTNERQLAEQMVLANDNFDRVTIMTRFLESKLRTIEPLNNSIYKTFQLIEFSKGKIDIENFAKDNFLSVRQFERVFKSLSGFSPKRYSRIIRFQTSLKQFGLKDRTLTDLAYEFGYADQSHFIREFKEFSGYTPKEYFLHSNEGSKWREN